MQQAETSFQQQQLQCPNLALAVYREVAAHLRQLEGIDIGLVPQQSEQFDYDQSQIGYMWIRYLVESPSVRKRVGEILAYYGQRYGEWQEVY